MYKYEIYSANTIHGVYNAINKEGVFSLAIMYIINTSGTCESEDPNECKRCNKCHEFINSVNLEDIVELVRKETGSKTVDYYNSYADGLMMNLSERNLIKSVVDCLLDHGVAVQLSNTLGCCYYPGGPKYSVENSENIYLDLYENKNPRGSRANVDGTLGNISCWKTERGKAFARKINPTQRDAGISDITPLSEYLEIDYPQL